MKTRLSSSVLSCVLFFPEKSLYTSVRKHLLAAFLMLYSLGVWGQILQWNTFGNTGTESTQPSVFNNTNISPSNLTVGSITTAGNKNRFGGSGWFNPGDTTTGNTILEAVAGNDYIQFVVTPNSGFSFTPTSFVFNWERSSTGPTNLSLRSSIDSFSTDLGVIAGMAESITSNTITISGLSNISTATTFRIYGYGATATTGTGGFDIDSNVVNVTLNGTVSSTCVPPANPVGAISGTTPACTSTILAYTGADDANAYWQTTATGTSTSEPATATKTVSTSGTYYVRIYDGVSCWSTSTVSKAIVINTAINITTQPANKSIIEGNNTSFNVVASGVASYQWQVDTGSGFNDLSNSAPYSNVTSATLNIANATLAMNGYKYRCVLTANAPCADMNTDGLATLTVTNAVPNNATALKACVANTQITLNWTAATGTPVPTGYIVFAMPNTTIPQMAAASAGNASSYIANTDYSAATTYTTLGKAVYKGAGTTATITGLLNLSQYTFKVVAYKGETGTGWAPGINASASWNQTYTIDVPEITNLAASINPTTSTVSWNVVPNSAGCYEYMVVANNGAVTLTPAGNGTAYPANANYAGPNSVVYRSTGNSVIVNGLTEDVNYCYKVFVRELNSGNQWSDGISICQTTGVNYCNSSGGTNNSMINNVTFNTINQTSSSTAGYTDYTAVTTSVILGEQYDLSVLVNTNGNYTSYVKAWIDWNRNGTFDSNEAFELGTVTNNSNGTPSASPFSITVPTNAAIGNVRMRVAANTDNIVNGYSTPCQIFNYGEVEDYTITVIQPVNAEINVRGGVASISIPNGFDSPYALNNTQFAETPLNTDSVIKDFVIENVGASTLNLSGSPVINIVGANPGDFMVTQQAPNAVSSGANGTFKIKFRPTVAGMRSAIVSIENNDSNENPYTFAIEGTGKCNSNPILNVFPISGPANTVVEFNSTINDLSGATVTFNDSTVPVIFSSSTNIEVAVPANANDGIFVVQLANGCTFTQNFDVIDIDVTNCESGTVTNSTNLIIYEVYDENGGSGGVVTIFNDTGATVDLSSYNIQRAPTYGSGYTTYANLSGTLANGTLAIIGVSSSKCGYTSTGNGSFGATGFNENDGFRLRKGTTVIDDVKTPNRVGYYMKRKIANLTPAPIFVATQWITQSISSGQCLSGVGISPVIKTPPTLTSSPQYIINCGITGAILNAEGTEGISGGLALAYQWYVLGTSGNWTVVADGGVYSGATTQTLTISNITGLDDYQYYCQIRENNATCYTATNSTQIRIAEKTWNGSSWTGRNSIITTAPTAVDKITLNSNYNTLTNGNLNGCSLKNNSPYQLTISGDTYANIQGNITNNGSILLESDGNLLQKNDAATFTGSPITAKREIVVSPGRQQYNYLISPLVGQSLKTIYSPNPEVLYHSESNNRFYTSTGAYIEGRGLAVKEPASGGATAATFIGPPKNGIVNFMMVKGGGDLLDPKRGYNLVGNPYPSNIDLVQLFNINGGVTGYLDSTVYFWDNKANSQTEQAGSNYGGQAYATFNMESLGQTAASGDPLLAGTKAPTRYVKTGQGFMVKSKAATASLLFNNSIRTTQNGATNFFGKNGEAVEEIRDKFWLNMITPTNIASNINIVYFEGGNNAFTQDDSRSMGGSDAIYSLVENEKVGINGRSTFVNTDVVSLGSRHFAAGFYRIDLAGKEGIFANGQNIYLKDRQTGILTNLSEGSYIFQANAGESTGRFEIIYKPEAVLATNGSSNESIITYRDGNDFIVKAQNKKITHLEVFDAAGRLMLQLKANALKVTIPAEQMVNGVYILKIDQNGELTTKKMIR